MAILFVILLLAGGWLGVTWAFFRLYQRDLTRVVEAAGSLMDPDAAPPDLPNVLAPAEAELRLARQQVQRNAATVSYTHLDVYKRQPLTSVSGSDSMVTSRPA